MAEDITLNQGTSATLSLSTELDSLANDADYLSSAVDLGATSEVNVVVELVYDCTGAATGSVYVYLAWSQDNSKFSTVRSDETGANDDLVLAVAANGTTEVVGVTSTPVHGRYVKARVYNLAGAAFASSGNTLKLYPVAVDQA